MYGGLRDELRGDDGGGLRGRHAGNDLLLLHDLLQLLHRQRLLLLLLLLLLVDDVDRRHLFTCGLGNLGLAQG